MATPPTIVSTDHLAEGTGVRSHNAQSTNAGDWLVVEIEIEAGNANTFQPAATGLSFSKQNDSGSNAGDSQVVQWTSQDSVGGSRTVQITPGGGSSLGYTSHLTIVRNTAGVGGKNVTATAQTVSLARQGSNSAVFISVCDFNVGNPASVTWVPGGTTQSNQQGTGATYCHGRWDDSGAQATAATGVSSVVFSGASTAALEMLGIAGSSNAVTYIQPPLPLPLLLQMLAQQAQAYSSTVSATGGIDWTQDATDETGLTDNQGVAFEQQKVTTDDAGLTDAATVDHIIPVTATDSAGLTDNAIIDRLNVVTDSAGLTDSAVLTVAMVVTDTTGLTDTSTVQSARLVAATDNAGLTDAAALTVSDVITDSAGLTDTTALTQSKVLTDSAGLTDAATVEAGRAVTTTDTAGLTDAATFTVTLQPTDSAGLTDAATITRTLVLTDTAGLTDAATVDKLQLTTTTDSAGLTDTATTDLLAGSPAPRFTLEALGAPGGATTASTAPRNAPNGALSATQTDERGAGVGNTTGTTRAAGAAG